MMHLRATSLHLLDSVGLLVPVYRLYESARSLSAETDVVGLDGLHRCLGCPGLWMYVEGARRQSRRCCSTPF